MIMKNGSQNISPLTLRVCSHVQTPTVGIITTCGYGGVDHRAYSDSQTGELIEEYVEEFEINMPIRHLELLTSLLVALKIL